MWGSAPQSPMGAPLFAGIKTQDSNSISFKDSVLQFNVAVFALEGADVRSIPALVYPTHFFQ